MFEFCENELQKKLLPVRGKFKDIEDQKMVSIFFSKIMHPYIKCIDQSFHLFVHSSIIHLSVY